MKSPSVYPTAAFRHSLSECPPDGPVEAYNCPTTAGSRACTDSPSKLGFKLLDRLPIYSEPPPVGLHTLVSLPDFPLRDVKRLCLVQAAPPITGWPPAKTEQQQPLRSSLHYRAFVAVGSEVARLRAGHRPPLKRYVQFSRIPLSRRLTLPRCNRRNQLNQVHQPVLAVQLGFGQLSPATVPPSLESMRSNASHNPAVEPVEELSDVGSLVMMSPAPQHRIQFLNQLRGPERHASAGKPTYLIHEVPDRFLPGIRI